MDSRKFIDLDLHEKAQYLWDKGDFIANRELHGAKIVLYQLYGYFVEATTKGSKIESIEVQNDEQILFLYVRDIDISGLIS